MQKKYTIYRGDRNKVRRMEKRVFFSTRRRKTSVKEEVGRRVVGEVTAGKGVETQDISTSLPGVPDRRSTTEV